MSKFTDFIDSIQDEGGHLAKNELKQLIEDAKEDQSEFVRLQAKNLERWTEMLKDGDISPVGYKKLVQKMEVLTQLDAIQLQAEAKISAQNLAGGIKELVLKQMLALI